MRTAIVGIGNSLMRDEGVGVHVARALADVRLPDGVEVIDAGTDPDVVFDLDGFDRVIVVDAARGGGSPGTVYRFAGDVVGLDLGEGRQACHDVGFLDTLRRVARDALDILILGVEPEEIEWGLDLSPVLRQSVPRVVQIVQQELRGYRCS
jgi:hydrogenase maturation protease